MVSISVSFFWSVFAAPPLNDKNFLLVCLCSTSTLLQKLHLFLSCLLFARDIVTLLVNKHSVLYIEGSGPEWCISSMLYGQDTPFWSATLDLCLSLLVFLLSLALVNVWSILLKSQNYKTLVTHPDLNKCDNGCTEMQFRQSLQTLSLTNLSPTVTMAVLRCSSDNLCRSCH